VSPVTVLDAAVVSAAFSFLLHATMAIVAIAIAVSLDPDPFLNIVPIPPSLGMGKKKRYDNRGGDCRLNGDQGKKRTHQCFEAVVADWSVFISWR
jgi:hypothetical protein